MTTSDLHPLVALAHTIDLAGDPLAALRAEFERIVTQEALILRPALFPLPQSNRKPLGVRAREPKK